MSLVDNTFSNMAVFEMLIAEQDCLVSIFWENVKSYGETEKVKKQVENATTTAELNKIVNSYI